jgi:hypothetical protein
VRRPRSRVHGDILSACVRLISASGRAPGLAHLLCPNFGLLCNVRPPQARTEILLQTTGGKSHFVIVAPTRPSGQHFVALDLRLPAAGAARTMIVHDSLQTHGTPSVFIQTIASCFDVDSRNVSYAPDTLKQSQDDCGPSALKNAMGLLFAADQAAWTHLSSSQIRSMIIRLLRTGNVDSFVKAGR